MPQMVIPQTIARIREHVNPLSRKYQQPTQPPNWQQVYSNPHQPLHLDIGCGWGKFLLGMAQQSPTWNFLGLEIREPLVEQANTWVQQQALTNLHYLFCNASNSLHPILSTLPTGALHYVTIQFPDPWFKRRHGKRRVVQPEMVAILADHLVPGGFLFVQSDIENVAREMHDRIAAHPAFQRQHEPIWLDENPLPLPTERELSTLSQGVPVYRALFTRPLAH